MQERRFEGGVALSLPGHSEGEAMSRSSDYAAWVAEEIEDIPGPRALVGHSLGGAIALEVALAAPELVDGLVILASGPRIPVPDDALARAREDFPAEAERLVRKGYATDDEEGLGRIIELTKAAGSETLARDYEACRSVDLGPRLAEVGAPVLVIAAAEDRLTPPASSEDLARGLPVALLSLVPDAGHWVMQEQPGAVDLLLAGFLARLELSLEE